MGELKELYPTGTCNKTDPIVRHDSHYESSSVVTLYRPQNNEDNLGTQNEPFEPTLDDAINYPLIRINSHLLSEDQIVKFVLHHDKLTPYLDLIFDDISNVIQFSDMPGLDNVITVVILEPVLDVHRPIKLDFYVTSCRVSGSRFYIQAEFKLLELEKTIFKQEKFFENSKCDADFCKLPENLHPTTYEFLHIIADSCGLGFAASQKCRSIKDDRYRLMKSEKYKNAAQEHTRCGGLDENSIFDSWIDTWGMLTMVNVPWILNEPVEPEELSINALIGTSMITDTALKSTRSATERIMRILSNVNITDTQHNMLLSDMVKQVNLSKGFYDGTLTEYQLVTPEGAGEQEFTQLSLFQVQEKEASARGEENLDDYTFETKKFLGFEMAELTPTLKQSIIHDEYFKQLRSHRYFATLDKINLGLERGCLVNVLWYVNDITQKGIIASDSEKLSGIPSDPGNDPSIIDQKDGILDKTISGTYYIDGIEWTYDNITNKFAQHLYLIKKGTLTQYADPTTK